MRPYLAGSLAFHALVAAAAAGAIAGRSAAKTDVYTIDFIGPSAIQVAATKAGAPTSSKDGPSPLPERAPSDEIVIPKKRRGPLPRPSLLGRETLAPAPEPTQTTIGPPADAAPAAPGAPGSPGAAGVFAELPNFPYPWYISQIRASLWARWSQRMPREASESVVQFSILPDGRIVDLRIESSSGDAGYDLTALTAAQDAAPFPPLPREFTEPFLKVHVTLKSR